MLDLCKKKHSDPNHLWKKIIIQINVECGNRFERKITYHFAKVSCSNDSVSVVLQSKDNYTFYSSWHDVTKRNKKHFVDDVIDYNWNWIWWDDPVTLIEHFFFSFIEFSEGEVRRHHKIALGWRDTNETTSCTFINQLNWNNFRVFGSSIINKIFTKPINSRVATIQ